MIVRNVRPEDHAAVIAVIDDWWGGRAMRDRLPRLFFEHFSDTSFILEDEGGLSASSSWLGPGVAPWSWR